MIRNRQSAVLAGLEQIDERRPISEEKKVGHEEATGSLPWETQRGKVGAITEDNDLLGKPQSADGGGKRHVFRSKTKSNKGRKKRLCAGAELEQGKGNAIRGIDR